VLVAGGGTGRGCRDTGGFRNQGFPERDSGAIRNGPVFVAPVFVQRWELRSRSTDPGMRDETSSIGHGPAAAPGGSGTSVRRWCKKLSRSTDACDLSMLSGMTVGYSGHPIRTRIVLADGAGTDLALALVAGGGSLWPVERLQRLVGASRFGQPGLLWIEAHRWVSRGPLRSPALVGPSPVLVSGGCWRFDAGRWVTRGAL